ncbi:MAG TPA: carboxypeptidase regulatory-like domain-containing protein [Pirellulales bacterium]|nr:carboxypeptidase regulatory-like domain-containing protein [Pirellulales bacterium]
MTAWSDWAGRWLLDYYAAASVVLAAVAIAGALVRSSAARMALSRAALAGLAILAVLCAAPGWPQFAVAFRANDASASAPGIPRGAVLRALTPHSPNAADPGGPTLSPVGSAEASFARANAPSQAQVTWRPDAFAKGRTTLRLADAAPWLVVSFLVGAGLLLARLLLGAVQVRRLCRRASAAPAAALDELKQIAAGADPPPRLLVSPTIGTAAAWGLLRPTIVLPERAIRSGLAIGPILAHEWAHIRRGDLWLLALVRGVQAALFAHPLFWLLRVRIRTDQELLADATAAECCGRCAYAEALVAWARFQAAERAGSNGMMGIWESRSLLTRRISMLLDERIRLPLDCSRRWKAASGLASLALVAGLSLFTLRPGPATFAAPPTAAAEKAVPNVAARAANASRLAEPPGDAELVSISGICLDEHQKPLAGAHVRVFRTERSDQVHLRPTGRLKFVQSFLADVKPGEGFSSPNYASSMESPESQRLLAQTRTDDGGKFQFAGLAADEAWKQQRAVVLVVAQSPGKGTQCERAMIVRRTDELPFVESMQFTLPAAVSLRGQVVDSEGKPVAGAVVSCPDACALAKPLPGIMCAVTDADGRFEIADLPPFDVANLPPEVSDFGMFARASAAVGIEHPDYAQQVAEYERLPAVVEATLQRPAALAGQIVDEESGQPAEKATVHWTHEHGFSGSTLTDQDGRYAATGLPPGKYTLRTWRADRLDATREVELHSGANFADLRLESGAFIQGIVIDEATGKPPLDFGDMPMAVHAMLSGEKPSDARAGYVQGDGTFSMTVRPGKNSLVFFHPRWRLIDENRWRLAGVEAARGQTVKVELRVASQRPKWAAPAAAAFAFPEARLSGKALVELLKATEYVQLRTEIMDGREVVTEIALGGRDEIDFEALAPQFAWLYENLLANLKEFSELRSLTLCPPHGCDEALKSLRELKKLESLMLADVSDLTAAGVAHLAALPNLKGLGLAGPRLDDDMLREIAELPKLESLTFGGAFTDEGLSHLQDCTHLKQLLLAAKDGARLTDRGVESLSGLTNLEHLELVQLDDGSSPWNITDAGLRSLAALPNLESLSLRSKRITDAGLAHLRGLKKLKQLDLGGSAISEAAVAELKQALPNLKVKSLGDQAPGKPSDARE